MRRSILDSRIEAECFVAEIAFLVHQDSRLGRLGILTLLASGYDSIKMSRKVAQVTQVFEV